MTDLLVAVDGSEANRAALDWAISSAERGESSLRIALVAEPWQVPGLNPPDVSEEDYIQPILDHATEVATQRLDVDMVDTIVAHGSPEQALVELAEGSSGLVVGSRGLGAIRRVLVGSTSIAVAGRCSVPVTIVPDTWNDTEAVGRPVLIGLDMEEQHDAATRHAFTVASSRGVALRVLQVWQPPLIFGEMAGSQVAYYLEWQTASLYSLKSYVAQIGQDFPDVEVEVEQVTGHPVDQLVDAAQNAQLLVLGRDEKERWSGFALGSVARGVLPHSEVPVTVVPAG